MIAHFWESVLPQGWPTRGVPFVALPINMDAQHPEGVVHSHDRFKLTVLESRVGAAISVLNSVEAITSDLRDEPELS